MDSRYKVSLRWDSTPRPRPLGFRSDAPGWSSTAVDVYTRSDIEAHKREPHLWWLYISHPLSPSHNVILISAFCFHLSLHSPFFFKFVRKCDIYIYIYIYILYIYYIHIHTYIYIHIYILLYMIHHMHIWRFEDF